MNQHAATAKTEVVKLTPALASDLLKSNTANRPLRARYASRLAGAMKRGEWVLNGDAIRVSCSGRLLDGQHRCAAVVESGVAIDVILVTGLGDETFGTIDRGLNRTTADVLSISGEANSATLAAMTRILHIYNESGVPFHGNPDFNPTTQQQIELLEETPELRTSASWASSSKWCRKYVTASLVGFCHFVFTRKDSAAAKAFFSGLESGVGLDAGSPVLLLRDRLVESYSSKSKLDPMYKAALVFKAFKLHRDGATVRQLRVRTEGDAAEKDIFVL